MEITEDSVLRNYRFKKCLGKGNFGVVWEALHQDRNEQVAIKIVSKELFIEHPKFESYLRTEVVYLPKIKHKNVARFIEFFENEVALYFVIEFCNLGDLSQYLKQKMRIFEDEALKFLKQLISAFQVLNSHKIMHRDLKLENILLSKSENEEITIKLCDFDFLKKGEKGNTYLGTCLYMAPEILKSNTEYTNKTDLWSLGVVFYRILYGDYPFKGKTEVNLIYNIDNMKIKYPEEFGISESSINLLKEIFQVEPDKRISWEKLYEMFNLPAIPVVVEEEEMKENPKDEHYKRASIKPADIREKISFDPPKNNFKKNEKIEESRSCFCFKKFK